jgi:hypothetical protein
LIILSGGKDYTDPELLNSIAEAEIDLWVVRASSAA